MKYILIASLLTSAVYAAPLAQVGVIAKRQTGLQTGQQTSQQNGQAGNVQNGNGNNNGNGNVNGNNNVQPGQNALQTGGPQNGQTPTAGDLATAVSNWQADTSMVSNFLNTGPSIQNNVAFKQAATVAFNAEVDELTHKAIIDAANGGQADVQAANSTLATGGSFQDVVDKLQEMSVKGLAASQNIDLINQNRCVNVLPNIDAYMASTGSDSQAIRPTACDQTGVAGGVQGTGATQPGQPAGSPAAAFAAAQDLAAGTGNGLVQNGADQGNAGAGGVAGQQGGQQTQNQDTQGANGGNAQGTNGGNAQGTNGGNAQGQGTAQDLNQGTAQGGNAQGTNQDTTQATAQGTGQDTAQGTGQGTAQGTTQGNGQDTTQGTAQGNGQGNLQGTNAQGQTTGSSQNVDNSQNQGASQTNGQSQQGQADDA